MTDGNDKITPGYYNPIVGPYPVKYTPMSDSTERMRISGDLSQVSIGAGAYPADSGMNDATKIEALQAALDQANMQIIEQRDVMQTVLASLSWSIKALEINTDEVPGFQIAITALREVLGGTE